MVLQASAPFAALVRLSVCVAAGGVGASDAPPGMPGTAAVSSAMRPPGCDASGGADSDNEGEDGAGERLAARARSLELAGRLHGALPEVRDWCVARAQAAASDTVQLVCPKVRGHRLTRVRASPGARALQRACVVQACCLHTHLVAVAFHP